MVIETTVRMGTENRQGQCCFSYFTFNVAGSGRRRRNILFSAGKLLSVNSWENLLEKGMVKLLCILTIYKWMREEGGRMMTDITYRVEGDYLIPNLVLDDEADDNFEEMIGIYGMMRESFLKEHQHGTYTAMLLMGKLKSHLREIDRQAEEEGECLLRQMMERQGVDEALKAVDQMAWVQKVNALRTMAEEVVLREIVYQ